MLDIELGKIGGSLGSIAYTNLEEWLRKADKNLLYPFWVMQKEQILYLTCYNS